MIQVQRQIDRLLAHRAAEWVETLKTGGERERHAFDAWLRQSPLHVTHFLEIVALGHEVQNLDRSQGEDVGAILKRIAPEAKVLQNPMENWERVPHVPQHRSWKIAVSLAAAIVLSFILLPYSSLSPWHVQKIDTMVGEQRSLTLADGSLVTVNTSSKVRIDYSDTRRTIDLKSGEAVFKVAHDASRPFEVRTRLATIRAIGTQFNVYQRPGDMVVSVLEGRVQVTSPNGTGPQILNAREEARVLSSGQIERRADADVSKILAWQQRRLSFEEAPLEEIVREFNRYNQAVQFRIDGVSAGTYHFGGIFDAYDTESLATLLSRESGLVVEKQGNEIVIRRSLVGGSAQ